MALNYNPRTKHVIHISLFTLSKNIIAPYCRLGHQNIEKLSNLSRVIKLVSNHVCSSHVMFSHYCTFSGTLDAVSNCSFKYQQIFIN